jgi:site-specific DNA-methyltransferase (adenine-specific)
VSAPYYEDEWVTLWHGDCREVTAWLEADVLVTDPPYGMAYAGFGGRKGEPRRSRAAVTIAGDETAALRDEVLAAWGDGPAIVFGTWRTPRPEATRALVVWHKLGAGGMGDLSMPWLSSHVEIYVLGSGFVGKRSDSVLPVKCLMSADAERPDHPTPKPVGLMERLVLTTVGTVADPFAGSGSTLLAAKNLGRRAVGIEVEEKYCEIAAQRLSQDTLFGGVA